MGDNPICEEMWFQIMFLTSARGYNAIRLYVLSVCRNLKATLIPVQLNYGEYPTSWLPGIFGFDLKRGKKQTACEWKSTDAKVQYATTFPLGDYLWRVLLTLLTQTPNYLLAGCYFIGDNRNSSCIFFLYLFFIHSTQIAISVWPLSK